MAYCSTALHWQKRENFSRPTKYCRTISWSTRILTLFAHFPSRTKSIKSPTKEEITDRWGYHQSPQVRQFWFHYPSELELDKLVLHKFRRMVWTWSSERWSGPEVQKDGLDRKLRRMVLTGSSEGWCCPETLKGCSGPEVQNDGLDRKLNPVG